MLYRCVSKGCSLYFMAFVNEAVDGYAEGDPASPCLLSTYGPCLLLELLARSGWVSRDIFRPSHFSKLHLSAERRLRQVSQVVLGDASVRILSARMSPATWWAACTPAGGEVLGSDW